jgi:hypothetical protein
MSYVATKTEFLFIRSERDLAGFERNYRRKVEQVVRAQEVMADPAAVKEHRWTDEGKREPFTVFMDPINKCVAAVIDGHI